jgi:hypothetical protein
MRRGGLLLAAACLLALGLGAAAARADQGQIALPQIADDDEVCLENIQAEEREHRIPVGLLKAIGLTESGRTVTRGHRTVWPWTVNAAGEGHFFETKEDAIAFVQAKQADGIDSIDVGCMQINLKHHPDAFASLEDAFDPAINVAYAADFLFGLRSELRSWIGAARRYHSATPERGEAYGERVMANWTGAAKSRELKQADEDDAVEQLAAMPPDSPDAAVNNFLRTMPVMAKSTGKMANFAGFYAPPPSVAPAAGAPVAAAGANGRQRFVSFQKVFAPRVTQGMTGLRLQDYRTN